MFIRNEYSNLYKLRNVYIKYFKIWKFTAFNYSRLSGYA